GHCGSSITITGIMNGTSGSGGVCLGQNSGNSGGLFNKSNGLVINSGAPISVSSPSNSINYDVTEWLFAETDSIWKNDDFYSPEECSYGMSLGACPSYQLGSLYGSHYRLFNNKGVYNIKIPMLREFPNGAIILCGSQGCRWVDYSTAGNIMFGILSARRGI